MAETLIRYRVHIQYAERVQDDRVGRRHYEKLFKNYKQARKDAVKVLKELNRLSKEILEAKITVALLEDHLDIN